MKSSVLIWSMLVIGAPIGAQEAREPKPVAAKPAEKTPPAKTTSAESAADRILRRLDQEFPKKPAPAAASKFTSHTTAAAPAPKPSQRLTLNWRIALQWPDELRTIK